MQWNIIIDFISNRYCWVSDLLTDFDGAYQYPKRKLPNMFIPLEVEQSSKTAQKKLIVGHNVGFDRSYVKEQYFLEVDICLTGMVLFAFL